MDRTLVRQQFNAAASPRYGSAQGGFHRRYAERLVELTPLAAGHRVLDVATGTGLAAIAAAGVVGPTSGVLGIDIAEGMVEEARRAAAELGLRNVTFEVGDGARLRFPGASFDAVLCSSAIIYMPVNQALREWRRVVAPSGAVAYSTLRADSPRAGVLFREVAARFGVQLDNPNAIGSKAGCESLLLEADLDPVSIVEEPIAITPATPEAAWSGNVGSAAFAAVRQLQPPALEDMRLAYLSALTADDLSEPYRVIYAIARRPSDPRPSQAGTR